jgi:hypothetical protein
VGRLFGFRPPPAHNSLDKENVMPTDKQREANRLNALHSTGPRTESGKSISAQNSFKHGLCVDDSTLYDDPETKADIEKHLARYFDYYQPQSPLEHDALEEIAICKIRLRHLQRAQMGLINDAREKMFDKHTFTDPEGRHWHFYDSAAHPPGDERFVANRLLGIAWQSVASDLDKMSRYEARIHSRHQKALKTFESLRGAGRRPAADCQSAQPATSNQPDPPVSKPAPQPVQPAAPPPISPVPATLQNEPNFDLNPADSTPNTPVIIK